MIAIADLDSQLDALVADPPWKLPPALPTSGDAALDEAIRLLVPTTADFDANVAQAIALSASSGHPDVTSALLATLDDVTRGFVPFVWRSDLGLPPLSAELKTRAHARFKDAHAAWTSRSSLFARIVYLLDARMDDALQDRMSAFVADETTPIAMRSALAVSLLGHRFAGLAFRPYRFTPEHVAPRRYLEALARQLEPSSPLVAYGAEAVLVLDPEHACARIRDALAGAGDELRTPAICNIGMRIVKRVSFDQDPTWIDLLAPMLSAEPLVSLALSNELGCVRTSAPLVAALRHAQTEPLFIDLLADLRRIDDPAAAEPLRLIAASLPDAPPKAKLARSRNTVLTLVKRLSRKRELVERATFVESAAVGTDGGPVVVLPKSVSGAWKGVQLDEATGEPSSDDDYSRACAAVGDGRAALLEVGGVVALVMPEQHCSFAALDGGCVFIASGSELMVEMVLRDQKAAKKRGTWHVAEPTLVMLDAAFDLGRAPTGAIAEVTLAAGTYALDELRAELPAGGVHALRLTRARTKP